MNLADLTTLRVGGPAGRLVEATTRDELIAAAADLEPDDLVLGGGSNLVVADAGVPGTVLRVATRGIADAAPGVLRVEAGEVWDDVVQAAIDRGYAGIEALSGIPGSTGASPIQNIGAYGQEVGACLRAVEVAQPGTGRVARVDAAELGLGYRTSVFKQGVPAVVLAVELGFDAAGGGLSRPIAYAQLASALGVRVGDRVPLTAVREAVLALRRSKGMVLDPGDPDSVSAGSFFTNPIVTESFARGLPADAPRFPQEPDEPERVLPLGSDVPPLADATPRHVKLSAAWLIERSGVHRGFAIPGSGAAISSKHTLAIVNRGGATAADVLQLADYVQTRVLSEFGVVLQPEPTVVGVADEP
ncbi:UDP-N-acetylmuramate dehydrogenase [Pseudolysinimonas sp.]|uniref:UDP-N-acetylmuramate dehydrogenase n=1 Tax=Pseudolysinimonas sp. TaxID=2680009 RepID=UPI003F808D1B